VQRAKVQHCGSVVSQFPIDSATVPPSTGDPGSGISMNRPDGGSLLVPNVRMSVVSSPK
jgi:hypothetical protein